MKEIEAIRLYVYDLGFVDAAPPFTAAWRDRCRLLLTEIDRLTDALERAEMERDAWVSETCRARSLEWGWKRENDRLRAENERLREDGEGP